MRIALICHYLIIDFITLFKNVFSDFFTFCGDVEYAVLLRLYFVGLVLYVIYVCAL